MASSHHVTHSRQVSARLTPPLWRYAIPLLPRRGHPHGRLCIYITPLVSICCKCKVHLNILWPSELTLNVPPFWYRFAPSAKDKHPSMPHPEKPSISRFARRPFIYKWMVRGPISHHRGGPVGVLAACRALCGLLCLTLWARPERSDEVQSTTGTSLDINSSGVQVAAFVINSI